MKKTIAIVSMLMSLFAQAQSVYEIKTESKFDVSNLYKSSASVDFREVGVPASVAHKYTLTTTYRIPVGMVARPNVQYVPQERICQRDIGGCQLRGGYLDAVLSFKDYDFAVIFELYDNDAKKMVATKRVPFEVSFMRRGVEANLNFYGVEKGQKTIASDRVEFTLADGLTKVLIDAGTSRIRESVLYIENVGDTHGNNNDVYRVRSILFEGPAVTRSGSRTIQLDYKRAQTGSYFTVGSDNGNNVVTEKYLGHTI